MEERVNLSHFTRFLLFNKDFSEKVKEVIKNSK